LSTLLAAPFRGAAAAASAPHPAPAPLPDKKAWPSGRGGALGGGAKGDSSGGGGATGGSHRGSRASSRAGSPHRDGDEGDDAPSQCAESVVSSSYRRPLPDAVEHGGSRRVSVPDPPRKPWMMDILSLGGHHRDPPRRASAPEERGEHGGDEGRGAEAVGGAGAGAGAGGGQPQPQPQEPRKTILGGLASKLGLGKDRAGGGKMTPRDP